MVRRKPVWLDATSRPPTARPSLAQCLPSVAAGTQRLPVSEAVAISTAGDRHDVVGVVGLVDPPAHHAGKGIPRQHRLPPASVGLVAIPTGCRVWSCGVVSLGA